MHLRWVFTVETAVTLLKNIFEFLKVLIIKFRYNIVCVPRGLVVKLWLGVSDVQSSIPEIAFLSSLRFFSSFFSFSFPLVFI